MKEKIDGRLRTRAALLGLCFPQAWMYVVSKGLVCRGLGFQLAFHMGLCLCLLGVAVLETSLRGRLSRRAMRGISTVVMAALPLLGVAGLGQASGAGLPLGLVGGASVALCFALWFEVHCQLPIRQAFCYILLGFSGGALGCLCLSWISLFSTTSVLVCSAVLPFLSCVALRRSRGLVRAEPLGQMVSCGAQDNSGARRAIAFLLAQIVIYVFVFGNGVIFSILQSASLEISHQEAIAQLNYGLRFLLPLLMVLWFVAEREGERRSYRPVANAVLLVMVFVLLAFWFLGGANTVVSYGMVSMSRNLVLILVYLVLLKLVKMTGRRPFVVFGLGRGLYEVAVACGIGVYAFLATQYGPFGIEQDAVYLTAFCVFVFLTSCLLATLQSLADLPEEPAAMEVDEVLEGEQTDEGSADERLGEALMKRYQLSERELEIVLLFARGNSKKRIAEIIVLSENTVRWYLQQIYAKLDVHNRDELLERLDSLKEEKGASCS